MNMIKIKYYSDVPKNFTGIAEYPNGDKCWFKEDYLHREDGPAIERADGTKEWWVEGQFHRVDGPAIEYSDGRKEWFLEGKDYYRINLKDYIILDHFEGKYGLMWYRLLDKHEILEYPDMPGLISY